MRYWLSYDLGLQGQYEDLFGWLDKQEAKECGDNVATFLSPKSRDAIIKEIASLFNARRNDARGGPPPVAFDKPRIYLIDMNHGGKFILGKRKVAPWTGYAQTVLESGEEK